jgi:hypothetical protein
MAVSTTMTAGRPDGPTAGETAGRTAGDSADPTSVDPVR